MNQLRLLRFTCTIACVAACVGEKADLVDFLKTLSGKRLPRKLLRDPETSN